MKYSKMTVDGEKVNEKEKVDRISVDPVKCSRKVKEKKDTTTIKSAYS